MEIGTLHCERRNYDDDVILFLNYILLFVVVLDIEVDL